MASFRSPPLYSSKRVMGLPTLPNRYPEILARTVAGQPGQPFGVPVPSEFEHKVLDVLLQLLHELGRGAFSSFRPAVGEPADSVRLSRLLCPSAERRKIETESEDDREPDRPHGHLGGGRLEGV